VRDKGLNFNLSPGNKVKSSSPAVIRWKRFKVCIVNSIKVNLMMDDSRISFFWNNYIISYKTKKGNPSSLSYKVYTFL